MKRIIMTRRTRVGLVSLAAVVAALSVGVASSLAGFSSIGNDTSARTQVDTYANFTIVDTNHPAANDGWITHIDYYAANTRPMAFVGVDSNNVVQWVGPTFSPSATGVQTWTPAAPIRVQQGWNIALYFGTSGGVIPYEYVGAPSEWTPNNHGEPAVGQTLTYELATQGRTYSFVAQEIAPTTSCAGVTPGSYTGYTQDGSTTYVPSTSASGVNGPVFTNGAAYKVESQGIWQFGTNPAWLADAEWSTGYPNSSPTPWVKDLSSFGFSPGVLDLMINSDSTIDWGAYNPGQLYTHDLVGTGLPTNFLLGVEEDQPSFYGDNTGGLCVSVFKDSVAPTVSNVAAAPNPVVTGNSVTLTATVDDSTTGGSTIAGADYKVGAGAWTPMSAADSSFDSATENVRRPTR